MAEKRSLLQEDVALVNAKRYGSTQNHTTLQAAITAIGSTKSTLFLDPGTWTIGSNVNVPSNIKLLIPAGTIVSISSGITLSVYEYEADLPDATWKTGTGTLAKNSYKATRVDWLQTGTGALERSISSKLLDLAASPLDFGGVGNGVANDTTAVQKAIDAAEYIFLPGGYTWLITTSLLVPNNRVICGAGKDSILKMDTGQTNFGIVNTGYATAAANSNIRLSNFAIDGGRATPAGSFTSSGNLWQANTAFSSGTYVMRTSIATPRVYLCTQTGTSGSTGPSSTGSGITDGTCVWNYVEDLWRSGNDPIMLSRVTAACVDHLWVYMARNNGIIMEVCLDSTVYANHLRDINKNGIYFSNGDYNSCYGNRCDASYGGIGLANLWYSSCTSNTTERIAWSGINVGRDCQYCAITNNTGNAPFRTAPETITGTAHGKTYPAVADDYRYGIYQSIIANNVCSLMTFYVSDNNVIANNIIYNSPGTGVLISASSLNTIRGNTVYNGGNSSEPWGFLSAGDLGNLGALQTGTQSVQNTYLDNTIRDDRANDGLQRWGFTWTESPAGIHMRGNMVSLDDSVTLAARFYNWNQDFGVFDDNYYSGNKRFLPTTLPTAREELRGLFYSIGGTIDTHYYTHQDNGVYTNVKIPYFAQGSFTITGTGFASNPTGTAIYQIVGDTVQLYIPQLSGTSNATSFTLTGMPAVLTPGRTLWMPIRIADNGTSAFGLMLITASSTTITLYLNASASDGWTASGTKTLYAVLAEWTINAF